MNKYEKILVLEPEKKEIVLKILELLNNESFSDAKEILDIAAHFVKENSYIDYNLAKDRINDIIEGD